MVRRSQSSNETIVAVATPPGRGALAVIRVSGARTAELISRHFRPQQDRDLHPWRPRVGHFLDAQGKVLDRVLVTLFLAPSSYTGEDLAEISCHGSPPLTRLIVQTLLQGEDARLARPGEFSLRAFLNRKMDLAQAEAVRDLVDSQTAYQARVASEQLEGRLSRALKPLKDELVRIISHMETSLEFVEEEVEPETRDELLAALGRVDRTLEELERSFRWGRIVHDGIVVAITGKPNAGKSSLFNALLREDRAIVTAVPGTTRDALSESISLEGIPARLVDTAGIRESTELVESLGVEKSLQFLRESDVVVFVLDGSLPFEPEDARIWELIRGRPCLAVVNKMDLPRRLEVPPEILEAGAGQAEVSALHGMGLEELRERLLGVVAPGEGVEREQVVLTSERHRHCVERARRRLQRGIEGYRSEMSEEFPLYDLRRSLDCLGEITGETTVEDILDAIFSTFCIGK